LGEIHVKSNTIVIGKRFQGPPESGNGGYVCGRLAQSIDAGAAVARLRVAPPLDTKLEVRDYEGGVALFNAELVVAEARPASVSIEVPEPPSYEEAEAASRSFQGFSAHPFPSCFVCGPDRDAGDGLRIFPGPIDGRDLVACPWVPDSSLGSAMGVVSPEFLWAALDCPGGFAFSHPADGTILLGELQVELFGEVSVGERCVLVGWELSHQGRKHHTATALFGESGICDGLGLGTWFEVPQPGTKDTA
jgi:hypothetical protein